MKTDYQSNDKITRYLYSQNIHVEEYNLECGGINIGGVYRTDTAELAYRFEEEDNSVILIFYRRLGERIGLKDAFSLLNEFIDICARLDVRHIKGMVSTLFIKGTGLSLDRMVSYYIRHQKAEIISSEMGEIWMGLDLNFYRQRNNISSENNKKTI